MCTPDGKPSRNSCFGRYGACSTRLSSSPSTSGSSSRRSPACVTRPVYACRNRCARRSRPRAARVAALAGRCATLKPPRNELRFVRRLNLARLPQRARAFRLQTGSAPTGRMPHAGDRCILASSRERRIVACSRWTVSFHGAARSTSIAGCLRLAMPIKMPSSSDAVTGPRVSTPKPPPVGIRWSPAIRFIALRRIKFANEFATLRK